MRRLFASLLVFAACAGPPLPPEEPRAKPRDANRRTGSEAIPEAPDPEAVARGGKQWGGWRYGGDRDDCFFVVGRKCFATRKAACKAATCGRKRCVSDGAGPATVSCR